MFFVVHNVGVIYYIMLCGYPPFWPEDDEIINMIKQITGGTFAFHSPQWDSISEASKGLIRRCLTVEVRYFCVHIRLVCRHAGMHASI